MYLVGQSDVYFYFLSVMSIVMLFIGSWQIVLGQVKQFIVFGLLIFQQVLPLVGCTEFNEINLISYTFICKQNFSFVRRA